MERKIKFRGKSIDNGKRALYTRAARGICNEYEFKRSLTKLEEKGND